MADMEFDLGEALGGYEQAQADRNFYLSMVQGGTQMASPIAAYLAGVSGVKMANMRAKAQAIEDKRQAEKDALVATEKAQKRANELDNQIINIMKGSRDGSIAPAAAAGMLGYVMKERGYIPKGYDADNNVMTYGVPGDSQDYQFSLEQAATTKQDLQKMLEEGRNARQAERIAAQKEMIGQRAEAQKDIASYKKSIGVGSASSEKFTPLSSFKTSHEKVLKAVGKAPLLKMLTYGQIKDFVEGIEGLAPNDRKQMEDKADEMLKEVYKIHPDWTFSSAKYEPGFVASPKSILDKYKKQ